MTASIKTATLARIYLSQGHTRQAIEILDELLAESPDDEALLAFRRDAEKQRALEAEGIAEKNATDANEPDSDDDPEDIAPARSLETAASEPDPKPSEQVVRAERIASAAPATMAAPAKEPERLRDRAVELGVEVVGHIAGRAANRLSKVLGRIRERRR